MNYRQEWAEGDIEAGTLLDAIEELQNEVIKLKNDKREYARLALQTEAESYPCCDYCGLVPSYHPWHGSGMINCEESPHIHACNECRHKLPTGRKENHNV